MTTAAAATGRTSSRTGRGRRARPSGAGTDRAPVVHDRLRDGEHRAAVRHRHLRLAEQEQQQRDGAAKPHRDLAVLARRSHRGESTSNGLRNRAVQLNRRRSASPSSSRPTTRRRRSARSSSASRRWTSTRRSSSSTTARRTRRPRSWRRRRRGHSQVELLRQPNRGKGSAVRLALTRDHEGHRGHPGRGHGVRPGRRRSRSSRRSSCGVADVVYGSRLSGGAPQRAYLFWHLMGNRFLSLLTGRSVQHDAERHGDRLQGVKRSDVLAIAAADAGRLPQ